MFRLFRAGAGVCPLRSVRRARLPLSSARSLGPRLPPRAPMMAFDSRSTPEPRTISAATRAALADAVVRLWTDPSRWQVEGGEGRRVRLDDALVAAVARTVREAQSRSLRAEEVIVAFKDLLGELPELLVPERRLEAAHFRERLITECIRAYYAR